MSPLLQLLISSIGLDVASPHPHPHSPLVAHYLIIYFFVFFFDLAGIQLVEDIFSPSRSSPRSRSTPSISLLSSMRKGVPRARTPRSTNRSLGIIPEDSVVGSTPTPSARTVGRTPKSSDLRSALPVGTGTGTGTYLDAVVAELVPLPLRISSANKATCEASFSARLARAGRALPRSLDTATGGERRYDVLNMRCADLTPIPAEDGWLTPKPLFEDMRASLWGASLLDYPGGSISRYDVEEDELERLSKALECAMDAALAVQDIAGEADELADEQWRVHAAPAEESVAVSADGESATMNSLAGESGSVAADEESFLLPPTPPLPFSLPERAGNRPARSTKRSSADREAMVEWSAAGRTWSMKKALAQWAADVEARKQKARVGVVAGTAWDQRLGNYQLAEKAKEEGELSGEEEGMEVRPLRPHGFVVVDEDRDEDESQEEWEDLVQKMHREL